MMFSSLLDRKLRELRASGSEVEEDGSDIEDDYMREIIGSGHGHGSTSNITEVSYEFIPVGDPLNLFQRKQSVNLYKNS